MQAVLVKLLSIENLKDLVWYSGDVAVVTLFF